MAFLSADRPAEHFILLCPPNSLVQLELVKPSLVSNSSSVCGSRAVHRLWERSRDGKLATSQYEVGGRT
eukprot:1815817-Amphidinium_carterae.1